MNVCIIWPFAQISDDFYYLGIWQCARYFVAALFKELALKFWTKQLYYDANVTFRILVKII